MDSNIKYKWILSKVDTSLTDQAIEWEEQAVKEVNALQADAQRKQVLEAMGIENNEVVKLAFTPQND